MPTVTSWANETWLGLRFLGLGREDQEVGKRREKPS